MIKTILKYSTNIFIKDFTHCNKIAASNFAFYSQKTEILHRYQPKFDETITKTQIQDIFKDSQLLDECRNIPQHIQEKIGTNLLSVENHPLQLLRKKIEEYFITYEQDQSHKQNFSFFNSFSPFVTTQSNFDDLLIPEDHVSRKPSDTYYLNKEIVLRCHTSAHQTELMKKDNKAFLVFGDVYRRDEIDATHMPIFHQCEGVKIFEGPIQDQKNLDKLVEKDLKEILEGLVKYLFGNEIQLRWIDEYFPFTDPSFELEIFFRDEWMEVLGCGVVHEKILDNVEKSKKNGYSAWAFGLGLERLAMVLFQIPDVRLFWTNDTRFSSQFQNPKEDLKTMIFKPYSKYPPCFKDLSCWIPDNFHENDFFDLVREIAGEKIEDVKLIDEFENKKLNKKSNCFRLTFRDMNRSLTNEEINILQEKIRESSVKKLGIELR